MKKILLILTGVVITVVALAGVGFAFAQGETPELPTQPQQGVGGNGRGRGTVMSKTIRNSPLHDLMSVAIADAFGLTVDELEAMHEDGEKLHEWAVEQGLTHEEFRTKMLEARENALQQAFEEGIITQEQAEQMLNHQRGLGARIRQESENGTFLPQGAPQGEQGRQCAGGGGGRGN